MNSIKLLTILCAVFVIALARKATDEEKEMFMAFTEDCRKSSNATDADMNEILEGNVPTSQGAKCTITCVMKQFKIVNENEGKLELAVDTIVKLSEANGADSKKVDLIRTVAEKCKSPAVTDECDFSNAVGKCVEAEGLKRGISANDF